MLSMLLSVIDEDTDKIYFEKLYHKYSDGIFRRILSMARNVQDAEDIAQEAWIKIARNVALFRGRDEKMIRSYLMRVAYNETVSFERKKKHEEIFVTNEEVSETLEDNGEIYTVCEKESVETIVECIRALGNVYSGVLTYYYLYHYTPKEISAMLDMKEITVRKKIERGREKLIGLLERRGICD